MGLSMAIELTLRESILSHLQTTPICELDELITACPGFTWSDVLLGLDQLRRSGDVRITNGNESGYSFAILQKPGRRPTRLRRDVKPRKTPCWNPATPNEGGRL